MVPQYWQFSRPLQYSTAFLAVRGAPDNARAYWDHTMRLLFVTQLARELAGLLDDASSKQLGSAG